MCKLNKADVSILLQQAPFSRKLAEFMKIMVKKQQFVTSAIFLYEN